MRRHYRITYQGVCAPALTINRQPFDTARAENEREEAIQTIREELASSTEYVAADLELITKEHIETFYP